MYPMYPLEFAVFLYLHRITLYIIVSYYILYINDIITENYYIIAVNYLAYITKGFIPVLLTIL